MMNRKRFTSFVLLCGLLTVFSQASYAGINDMTSPLQGQWTGRTVTLSFGANWVNSCGGLIKKHVGTDVQAWAPEAVYAAEAGVVKVANSSPYGGWITIEHTPPGEPVFTTVYWHVTPVVSVGTTVAEGQWIGNIANLGNDTHFHFGVRIGTYSNTSNRGGLPQNTCGGDPAYPENFINPLSKSYNNK